MQDPDSLELMRQRISYLHSGEGEKLVSEMFSLPADMVALRLHGKCPHPNWVATQVACLQKARTKLPTWFGKGCVMLPVPLEQCTSEAAALLKPELSGRRLLDLTTGLGVDAWHLSKGFDSVVTLERDPGLAELARHNFQLLGTGNIEVITTSAEDYLLRDDIGSFDVIYVDPARRDAGGRKFLLESCSPNVIALRERMLQLATHVWIKVSPLFDLTEGIMVLHPVKEVLVISVEGEVKEVLFSIECEHQGEAVVTAAWQWKGVRHQFTGGADTSSELSDGSTDVRFVLEPDVALYKAGLEQAYMANQYPQSCSDVAGGYFYSNELPADIPGKVYEVMERMPYQTDRLRKRLKELGISQLNLTRRAFDVPLATVRDGLRVKEGGDHFLLLTRDAAGRRWAMLARRVNANQ